MKDNPSFLSRWSQRKTEQQEQTDQSDIVYSEDPLAPLHPVAEELPGIETEASAELATEAQEESPLTDEDMPEIETLNQDSDFKQFFSPGVSEELRNLALRKLFLLPEFNIRDGLNDYDDDFSKMPELTKAVVDKLRSWVNEKEEDLKEELTEKVQANTAEENEEEAIQPSDKNHDISTSSEINTADEDDDIGDADLDG